jgi:hypothetical protein
LTDLALIIIALALLPLVVAVGLLMVAAVFWLLVTLVSDPIGPVVGIWALLLLAGVILWGERTPRWLSNNVPASSQGRTASRTRGRRVDARRPRR